VPYIELELYADTDTLAGISLSYLQDAIPGWQARPGNIETVLLEANAQATSEAVDQASVVAPVAFAALGQSIYGIPQRAAVPAVADATFTFSADTPAVLVPQGAQLLVPHPAGTGMVFTTDADMLAPQGGGTLTVGVTALEPGAQPNGAFGASELVDDFDGITGITTTTAQGGADAESDDEYIDRLAEQLTLLAPRPILPNDFAVMALAVPGVGRALAIDLYQPNTAAGGAGAPRSDPNGATNVPRCVTVAITAEDGAPADTALCQRVYTVLDNAREVNFLVYVIPAGEGGVYTAIDVRATVRAYPGNLQTEVAAAAESMIRAWLDPAQWGTAPGAGTSTRTSVDWAYDTKARLYEAVDYLNRANGVFYVETVELKLSTSGTWGTADITLPGVAPMPAAGAVTITVTTPP
jgi:hypothetical protein